MTWKIKRADGISLGMYNESVAGVLRWLTYGVITASWPVIAGSSQTLLPALFISAVKLRCRDTDQQSRAARCFFRHSSADNACYNHPRADSSRITKSENTL